MIHLGQVTRRGGGAIVALALTFAGCGGAAAGDAGTTDATIPGGAAMSPKRGAAEICGRLSRADELRGLGDAITGWAQRPPAPGSANGVRAAGETMRRLASDADAVLAPMLRSTGRRLEQVAGRGVSARSARTLAAAMGRLGRALEGPCGYPVG